jgi:hypothetical protein
MQAQDLHLSLVLIYKRDIMQLFSAEATMQCNVLIHFIFCP